MGKKHRQNWQRNLPLSKDTNFINSIHHFVPDDFEYYVPNWLEKYVDNEEIENIGWNPPLALKEMCCRLLNFWRIEYVTLANNGMPLKSYKPEVAQKILKRKIPRLERKKKAAETLMRLMGMRLKDGFNRLDKNEEPRFTYDEIE